MIGICLELKSACKYCSNPLMLNSATTNFLCTSCNKPNAVPIESWKAIFDSAFDKIGEYKIGEGGNSTVPGGEYKYNLVFGRQDPACNHCKEKIDLSSIENDVEQNNITCNKCSNPTFVRKQPNEWAENFPGILFFVGEDKNLIASQVASEKITENSIKPVLFNCPSCAGSLKVDGTNRMVECTYCNSNVYLPDDLWLRMHPIKEVQRWYIMYDEAKIAEALPFWFDICDTACDKNGNVYFVGAAKDRSAFQAWSMGPDFKKRWIRTDLGLDFENSGITIGPDGNIYIWDSTKDFLLILSADDGSTIRKIENNSLRLKGCSSLVIDSDGSILALVNSTFARYSPTGERIQLWDHKKFGFAASGVGEQIPVDNKKLGPDLDEISNYPENLNSALNIMHVGYDGFLYFTARDLGGSFIARYDRTGKQLMFAKIPFSLMEGKCWTDDKGCTYCLTSTNFTAHQIIKISADGKSVEVVLKDKKDGGDLKVENRITLAPDGTIYATSIFGQLKVFSPDRKIVFMSKQSAMMENAFKNKKSLLDNFN